MQLKTLLIALGVASTVSAVPTAVEKRATDPPIPSNSPFILRRCSKGSSGDTVALHQYMAISRTGNLYFQNTGESPTIATAQRFSIDESGFLVQPGTASSGPKQLRSVYTTLSNASPVVFDGAGLPLVCQFVTFLNNGVGKNELKCVHPKNSGWKSWANVADSSQGTSTSQYRYIYHGSSAVIDPQIYVVTQICAQAVSS
ncbi:hypothetical protein Dda_0533 [Drechslerella dactyloides]|uniref:Uncharacterized protein n=1 Tax=Drechslerella dactyloides TaxID=74499 RepID=A0AAD6J7Y0_DREDA|nr:hypothetical protein Dda_0533 [Drechslerella dactyloides]